MCFPSRNNQQCAACASQSLNGPAEEIRACPKSREEKVVLGGGQKQQPPRQQQRQQRQHTRDRVEEVEGKRLIGAPCLCWGFYSTSVARATKIYTQADDRQGNAGELFFFLMKQQHCTIDTLECTGILRGFNQL